MTVLACACPDTAKIEANAHRAELQESARQLMNHLVLQ
jgi:hypothetical protein